MATTFAKLETVAHLIATLLDNWTPKGLCFRSPCGSSPALLPNLVQCVHWSGLRDNAILGDHPAVLCTLEDPSFGNSLCRQSCRRTPSHSKPLCFDKKRRHQLACRLASRLVDSDRQPIDTSGWHSSIRQGWRALRPAAIRTCSRASLAAMYINIDPRDARRAIARCQITLERKPECHARTRRVAARQRRRCMAHAPDPASRLFRSGSSRRRRVLHIEFADFVDLPARHGMASSCPFWADGDFDPP